MKKNTLKYKIVGMLMAVVFVAMSFPIPGCAAEFNSLTTPDKKSFAAANKETPVTNSYGYFYSKEIKNVFDGHILHFRPKVTGYYKFYSSQVNGDSKGEIFQRNKTLFSSETYDSIVSNDDGLDFAGNNGNSRNFMMVARLSGGANYFMVSRMFANNTGWILNNIAPNDDKIYSETGGRWVYEKGNTDVRMKTYYTKEQALGMFQSVFLALFNGGGEVYKQSGIIKFLDTCVKHGSLTYTTVSIVANAVKCTAFTINPVVGAAFTISSLALDYYLENCAKAETPERAFAELVGCGLHYSQVPGGYKFSVDNGICITEYRNCSDRFYTRYDAKNLIGEEFNCGHWEGICDN